MVLKAWLAVRQFGTQSWSRGREVKGRYVYSLRDALISKTVRYGRHLSSRKESYSFTWHIYRQYHTWIVRKCGGHCSVGWWSHSHVNFQEAKLNFDPLVRTKLHITDHPRAIWWLVHCTVAFGTANIVWAVGPPNALLDATKQPAKGNFFYYPSQIRHRYFVNVCDNWTRGIRWWNPLRNRVKKYPLKNDNNKSCVRLFSWHICYLLCQEPEEELIFTLLMKTSGGSRNVNGILIFWSF